MTSRENVYKCIDGERSYQTDLTWNHKDTPTLEAELLLLENYIRKATSIWCDGTDNTKVLDIIRKIAGISVRCLEHNGCPPRK